jgi:small subunit ribosomal protein S4
MARYTGSNCKLCRREGVKLFLKGTRCHLDKCSFEKRGYIPGMHWQRRPKLSEYGLQLREKQKAKRIYGLLETQFHTTFLKASKVKGVTGDTLMRFLETRLDNVIYRLGFAPSRKSARQLVRHRHITVNDRLVDIPSYRLSPGDRVQVREKSRQLALIHEALKRAGEGQQAPWLSVDKGNLSGVLLEHPTRENIPTPVEEQLIVELYSK